MYFLKNTFACINQITCKISGIKGECVFSALFLSVNEYITSFWNIRNLSKPESKKDSIKKKLKKEAEIKTSEKLY
jgi:hypothetical protein